MEQALPIEFKFIPKVKFEYKRKGPDGNDRVIGVYFPGMSYNCSKSPLHDQLREECKKWEANGMITIIPLSGDEQFKITKPANLGGQI